MTNAKIGFGNLFAISDDQTTTGTFADVAEVTNITPPNYSRDAVEATHTASPDSFREYVAGLMDAGEVQIELNFVPAVADTIIAAMTVGQGAFKITFTNAVTWTFLAVVTNYAPGAPLADRMTASATFKITGKPVLA